MNTRLKSSPFKTAKIRGIAIALSLIMAMLVLPFITFTATTYANENFVFSLQDHLTGLSGVLTDTDLEHPLQRAGGPTITVQNGGLLISDRSETWHALDLLRDFAGSPLQAGDVITISGTAFDAPAGSEIVVNAAESPWTWISNILPGGAGTVAVSGTEDFSMTLTLTDEVIADPAFVRIRIGTNGPGESIDFLISQLDITRAGGFVAPTPTVDPTPAAPVQPEIGDAHIVTADLGDIDTTVDLANAVLIYSLATDPYITANSGATDLNNATYLESSGNPTITIVNGNLQISNRGNQWYSLDVLFAPLGLQDGGSYLFIAAGTGTNGQTIGWHRTDAPWVYVGAPQNISGGTWELSQVIVYPNMPDIVNMPGIRIQTDPGDLADFTITDIRVYRLPDDGTGPVFVTPEWDLTLPSLAEVFAPFFTFGNIYSTTAIMDQFDTRTAFVHHFNSITAENWHKPDQIAGPMSRTTRPTVAEFNFENADRVLEWAIENDLEIIFHALFWHSQTPAWFFGPEGNRVTRAEALDNMEFYARTLAEHFTAQGTIDYIFAIDVVNEAIHSGGGTWGGHIDDWNAGDWRTQMRGITGQGSDVSGWWEAWANGYDPAAGEHPSDWIFYAFYIARRYFPNAILYYNDYNEFMPAKRNAIAQMIEQVNQRWATHPSYDGRLLIERIGMQSHFHMTGWTNWDLIRPAIQRFAATGVPISVTELDVTIGGFGGPVPAAADIPAYLERQAELYARLFGYYLEFSDYIERVTFWGLADHQSWRSAGLPLIFDHSLGAKPAFHSIIEVGLAHREALGIPFIAGAPVPTPPITTPMPIPAPVPGGIMVLIDGVQLIADVPAQLIGGSTMLPLRAVFEAISEDIQLDWNEAEGIITATWDDNVLVLQIGNNVITFNGQKDTIPQAPVLETGRTLVPIRIIAESFGADVQWDGSTETVTITLP